jgi:hypothetical protein
MGRKRINDGLTKWQRYRLKDVQAYRKRKREYAKIPKVRRHRRDYMRTWRKRNNKHYLAWSRANAQTKKNRRKRLAYGSLRSIEKHGISVQTFLAMLSKQRGRCAICHAPSPKTRRTRWLHIDHDHRSGHVRGLLCSRCNGALGWFEKYYRHIAIYLAD